MNKPEEKEQLVVEREEELDKEIEQARKEGKSEAWIRMNLDI
ncbi:hypothetical protein ACG0Z4_29715 [Enterocloster aldenensis]